MKHSNSNVIVYVQQPLQTEQTRIISQALCALRGVLQARTSSRSSRVICVDYDPVDVDSQRILRSVTSCGFDARLVGM